MKKKLGLTLAAVAMVGTLAVGGTLAWFTDTKTATNVITVGNIAIELQEKSEDAKNEDGSFKDEYTAVTKDNDGIKYGTFIKGDTDTEFDKNARVANTGSNPAIVRVTVSAPTGITVHTPEGNVDWKFYDGAYYYKKPLEGGGETADVIDSFTIDSSRVVDGSQDIKVTVEAIQFEETGITEDDLKSEDLTKVKTFFDESIK